MMPPAIRLLDRHAVRFAPPRVIKEFFSFAWKVQVSGVLALISAQGDAIFVGRFAAPQMTAFGTGSSFATTLRQIPMNAGAPMEATIVRAIGALGIERAAAETANIQRLWVRIVAGWIAVGVPAAGFGVTAWLHLGTNLPGQVAAVVLLANGVTMVMLVQRFWLNALGRSGLTLSHDVINTVVNLSVTFPLILAYGALGTISATLFAALVAATYLTWIGQRRVEATIPAPWLQVPWGSTLGAFALSAVSTWAVAQFLAGQLIPLGPLSLLAIGAAAAPALLLYFMHTVGVRRLREILGSLKGRRA